MSSYKCLNKPTLSPWLPLSYRALSIRLEPQQIPPPPMEAPKSVNQRRSPRLKGKSGKGKTIIKMAHELIAKKWGILDEGEVIDNMTLQQYLDIYKQPLNEQSMDVIVKLIEVVVEEKTTGVEGRGKGKNTSKTFAARVVVVET
jgi:hypothetical protein